MRILKSILPAVFLMLVLSQACLAAPLRTSEIINARLFASISILTDGTLTITYSNSDSDSPANAPLEITVDLFDASYRPLKESYPVDNYSKYIRPAERLTSISSGQKLKIGKDQAAVISGLPAGTRYRLSPVIFKDEPDIRIAESTLTGSIDTDPLPVFSSHLYRDQPRVFLVFRTELAANASPENAIFHYELSCSGADASSISFEKEFAFQGPGTYAIPVNILEEGTYNFTLKQTSVTGKGLKADPEAHTFTVYYSPEYQEGMYVELSADETLWGDPPVYIVSSKSTTFSPEVFKNVEGEEKDPKVFTFRLSAEDGDSDSFDLPASTETEAENEQTGTFDPITFYENGTYHFNISETGEPARGYTYDPDTAKVTVRIEDAGDTLSVAEAAYSKADSRDSSRAVFTNTYAPDTADFTPEIQKTVEGDAPGSYENFSFEITPDGNNPNGSSLKITQTVTAGAGKVSFPEITFSKAGTYNYTISEQDSGGPFAYDSGKASLKITVTDESGYLKATGIYTKDEISGPEAPVFTNRYKAGSLKITKRVEGESGDTAFTFKISLEGTSDIFRTDSGTVTDGSTFSLRDGESLTVTGLPAGLPWSLKETDIFGGFIPSYSPDDHGIISDGKETEVVCTNTFSSASFEPKVKKTVLGENAPEETFTFRLVPSEENTNGGDDVDGFLETAIRGSGEAAFPIITFTKAGTYHYTISEIRGSSRGFNYDKTSCLLEVVVEESNGKLIVKSSSYIREN